MSAIELTDEQLEYIVQRCNHALLDKPRCWGKTNRVVLGDNVHLANTLFNTMSGMIVLGDDVFFGHNVTVLTGTHDFRKKGAARHYAIPDNGRDIFIGSGTWIASGVTIIGPCRIGENAVISAASLVLSGDYPGGYIYAGAPARAIKAIDFDDAA